MFAVYDRDEDERFVQKELIVRVAVVSSLLYVVVCGIGMAGCAKPGPVRTKALTVPTVDETNNPGIVSEQVNEDAKKMGAYKK